MRDPKRIRKFLNQFADIWEAYFPDMRFGQLIQVFFARIEAAGKDPFYIEEDEMTKLLKSFANEIHQEREVNS